MITVFMACLVLTCIGAGLCLGAVYTDTDTMAVRFSWSGAATTSLGVFLTVVYTILLL